MKQSICLPLLALACVIFSQNLFAQLVFTRIDSIPVKIDSVWIKNPWAGGINWAQFSEVDMDGNGIKDLFVFDRCGNRVTTFLNGGAPNQVDYKHAPEFQSRFPDSLNNWALLADYNCDGKEDLFTCNGMNGITVYRNDYNGIDGIKFTLITPALQFTTATDTGNIFLMNGDIPAIADIDNDGDWDIISFNVGGMCVYYYKNLSMEDFGTCDSLKFTIASQCWGKFTEAFATCDAVTNIDCITLCGGNSPPHSLREGHAGSTTLALDLDGDADKELIVGDIACTKMYMTHNGGSSAWAFIDTVYDNYPAVKPVNIFIFPAAFFLDADNDGIKDLLAAPNAPNASENFTSVWYYKNVGTNTIPVWSFQQKDFLQDGMVEIGEGANPAFLDYDADGLTDMIIGNYGYYVSGAAYRSGLSLYRNIGSNSSPKYELITRDFAGLTSYNLLGIYPAFGDMDGDGDWDMIVGDYNGYLHYFQNTAGAGNPVNYPLINPNFKNIDVGLFAAPQIFDLNQDGKLDLIVGERNGNVNYFQNIGTITSSDFNSTPANDSLGCVDISEGSTSGYSSPYFAKPDSTGKSYLLVGSEWGTIYLYKDIEGNINGCFTLADSLDIKEGPRVSVVCGDVNGDGAPDLLIGNYCGGVALYFNENGAFSVNDNLIRINFVVKIFPNPFAVSARVRILGLRFTTSGYEARIYDLLGREMKSFIIHDSQFTINRDNLLSGMYFIKIFDKEKMIAVQKLVVQ